MVLIDNNKSLVMVHYFYNYEIDCFKVTVTIKVGTLIYDKLQWMECCGYLID